MQITAVSTEVWGPKAWGFLHAVTFRYPEFPELEDRDALFNLLTSLKLMLPCVKCRKHFAEYIDDPSTGLTGPGCHHLDTRWTAAKWLVEFHNVVNQRLIKPVVSFESVRENYSGDYVCPPPPRRPCGAPARTEYEWTAIVPWVSLTVLLCVVAMALMRRHESLKHQRQLLDLATAAAAELSYGVTHSR